MNAQIHVIAPRSEITPLQLLIMRKLWEKPRSIPQLYWDVCRPGGPEYADYLEALAVLYRTLLIEAAVEPRLTEKGRICLLSLVVAGAGRPEVEGMMRIAEVSYGAGAIKASVDSAGKGAESDGGVLPKPFASPRTTSALEISCGGEAGRVASDCPDKRIPAAELVPLAAGTGAEASASALESRIDSVISRLDHSVNRALAATKFCECGAQANFLCDCEKPICSRHSYDTFGEQCDFGICGECVEDAAKHYGDIGGKNL